MPDGKVTLLMVNDYPEYIDPSEWRQALSERVPGLDFRLWPNRGDPADVDLVLIDKGASPALFDGMKRLRAIVYLGAGMDGLHVGDLPAGVGVVRIATRELERPRLCSTSCFASSTTTDMLMSMRRSNSKLSGTP
jgi:glyoxylate/hydroxypyruvate reductase